MSTPRPTSYWDYIRVDDLLDLQRGLAQEEGELSNEEVLFITVHQIFELWFKLMRRDLVAARDLFKAEVVAEQTLSDVVARLRRVATILRVATAHFEVVETLGTREYLAFRGKLGQSSGFQSGQMRQIEIVLGLEDSERVPFASKGTPIDALRNPDGSESPSYQRVARDMEDRPSLKLAIDEWLRRTPIDGSHHKDPDSEARLDAFVADFLAAHRKETEGGRERAQELAASDEDRERIGAMYDREIESVRAFLEPTEGEGGRRRARVRAAMLFIETYRELPLLAWPREVLASLIELEQAFLVFRQRHARMVERVIGRRAGTGGTAGVDYLDQTALSYRIFRDLWAIRAIMVRREAAPKLSNENFYAFREA
jgi:tryptophan 2,3-dioxygenase